ncbi:hypothetical protein HOS33_gp304 [Erwinia phage vB_EamM_Y3]|uniref:Putative membrane protein n=1 Tax=Erwinia phage vB_EamM_Y3 TaxID=1983553 RepID=A0A2H4IBP0_9CAUD|nr:hypothetical protein HOS33_gp304 [Erwinia phage vB_EamM_Y3]ARW58944.1 putative membrane protein [Erwinia phage vB_EamM_Y3]
MRTLKRINIGSDTNFFALNAIVVPVAAIYMDVTMTESGKELKLPVRVDPNVSPEAMSIFVEYKLDIPVLACHPISDTEFYTEIGFTSVNARRFNLEHRGVSPIAYMGMLPDVTESDVGDKRYVAPLSVYQLPERTDIPKPFSKVRRYGAVLRTDYLHTPLLDAIDDETWAARLLEPTGMMWSEFLEGATNGRFTPADDLSECFGDLDAEFVPESDLKYLVGLKVKNRMKD